MIHNITETSTDKYVVFMSESLPSKQEVSYLKQFSNCGKSYMYISKKQEEYVFHFYVLSIPKDFYPYYNKVSFTGHFYDA